MLRKSRSGPDLRQIGILVLLALVLTIWQHRARATADTGSQAASLPERLVVRLAWPLQRLFAGTSNGLHNVVGGMGQYRKLAEENRRLRAERDELMAQKLRLTEARTENQRLRKLIGFAERDPGDPLVARVIGINYGLSRKRLTIVAPPGRRLEVGNIVRTEAGLVGRVSDLVDSAGKRAYVFPLIDAEHAVAAIVQRSRDQGMVRVAAQPEHLPDLLVMDRLIGRADIREGDVLLTSGMGETYPPGIPLGTVVNLQRSGGGVQVTALIRPFVDFDHLSYVLVERYGG